MGSYNRETKGSVDLKEWGNANESESYKDKKTDSISEKTKDLDWKTSVVKDGAKLFAVLELNFAFTASLISVVGYIIIASFGEMNSVKKYFGYLFFLIFVFLVYKLSKEKIISVSYKDINKFLLYISLFFLLIFLFQNFDIIKIIFLEIKSWF